MKTVRVNIEVENPAVIGQNIRVLAAYRGLNHTELSKIAGVSNLSVGNIVNGRNFPQFKTLSKIAVALGVPVTTLLRDDIINKTALEQ